MSTQPQKTLSHVGAESPSLLASSANNHTNICVPNGRIIPSLSNISLLSLANNNTAANLDCLFPGSPIVDDQESNYTASTAGTAATVGRASCSSQPGIQNALSFVHNQNDIINQKRNMHYNNSDAASSVATSPGIAVSSANNFAVSPKPRVSKLSAQLKKSSLNSATQPLPNELNKHFPSITSPISSSFMHSDDFPITNSTIFQGDSTLYSAFSSSPSLVTKSRLVNVNVQLSSPSCNKGRTTANTLIATSNLNVVGSSNFNATRGIRIADKCSSSNGSGSESPVLGPVQTPSSEICMTPLTLNDGSKF